MAADKKISELTSAGALAGTEALPIVQSSVTVKTTAQTVANLALTSGATGTLPVNKGGTAQTTVAAFAADLQGTGLDVDAAGFRGIPANAQAGNYTLVAADAGKHIYHALGDGAGDTYTIPANASVAFEVGTALTFVNMATDTIAIAITSDTMYLAGAGTTGSRTLAQFGIATAVKLTSTTWLISGTGLT